MAAAFFMVRSYEYTWIFPDPTGEYDCSFGVDKYAWIYHRSLWSSRLPIQSALKHGVAHNVLNMSKMKMKMEILNALILTLTHLTWVSSAQNVRHKF